MQYIKKYKGLFFFNIVAIIAYSVTELGMPTIMGKMIDEGITSGSIDLIRLQGLQLLGVALIGGLGNILLVYTATRIATRMTEDIRNDVFEKTQQLSHAEYNSIGVSSLITRISNDAYQIQLFVQMLLRMGLNSPIMIFASAILVYKTSVTLALIVAISVPFILFIIITTAIKSNILSKIQQQLMDTLNRITRENITGVRVIRAFRKDDHETERFKDINDKYTAVSKKIFVLMTRVEPLFFFVLNITSVVTVLIASKMIDLGTLEVGNLVAFIEYQFHALFSLLLFSTVFVMYPRAVVSAKRIQEVLDMEISVKNNPILNIKDHGNKIEFNDVSFAYPDGSSNVLSNISFSAEQGETVAFIGSTGSGKSTLINLLVRFFDVTSGSVEVNGNDVRDYDIYELRKKFGFIRQKALLFSGSISENIRYGRPLATLDEVKESAALAASSDFIEKRSAQYESYLTEGGSNLSGGQKQRLSIARALVRKPDVYVFDDSFSALDYKTDATIRKNLKAISHDSIVLIVAQRISSIMDADQIIVLNEGNMVGKGTHQELMRNSTIYREIAKSQLSEEELNEYESVK